VKANLPLPCYHCALPVPAGQRWRATVLEQTRDFCCPGCQAVAEAIVANGLAPFYQHRSDASQNPRALPAQPPDELALFDREDVQRPFVRELDDGREITLMVEGISCAACGWLIEKHLRALPEVREARLNLSSQRLHLRWHAEALPLSQVLGGLRRIGYAAWPWQADQASERLAADNRRALRQLGVAGLLWFQAMMATMATWPEFNLDLSPQLHTILRWVAMLLTTPIVFYSCRPFFLGAARDLRRRQLGMDVSVALAIGGAYGAGLWTSRTGQGELYFDAVGMFALFLLSGRYLERRARARTAQATTQLVNLLPASCLRLDEHGHGHRVLLGEMRPGQRVLVPAGALIGVDGHILDGQSRVDEALLSGESLPQWRGPGARVTGGTLNIDSALTVEVLAVGAHTQLSAMVRLLERAQAEKPRLARIADQAAHYFVVVSLALAVAVGLFWWHWAPTRAFWVVLAMLVATCPCALSLATPTALVAATGSLQRLGLLLSRGHVLEGLGRIDTLIVDKTGTLTEGRLRLRAVQPLGGLSADACLALAAALENHSEHPIARAFGRAEQAAEQVRSVPGLGLEGRVEGRLLRIGAADFVCALSATPVPRAPDRPGQSLLLGDRKGALAWLLLDDPVRGDADRLLQACRARGWRILLLSGDRSAHVAAVAAELGIDDARGGLDSKAKLAVLRGLQAEGRKVLVLGDGVNDAPVLAAADISVAMGSGTDLARVSADAVLLGSHLGALVDAFDLAARTRRVIAQNLTWAVLYNGLMLPFAALGWVTPLWAALGMSVSSLTVVLNALRLTRPRAPR
jgi:Cu2+-exporting ATPase